MIEGCMEDLTITDLINDLVKAVAALTEQPHDRERQRDVCLSTRSLDSCFYTECIFAEHLDDDVASVIETLYGESLEVLPRDCKSYCSVQTRLDDFLAWTDEFRSGEILEITA